MEPLVLQSESGDQVIHHQSARARRRKGRGAADVGALNLTSMIDVIFQLLIYFVVTASFMVNEGVLAAKLPQGSAAMENDDELPPEIITLRLTSGDDPSLVAIERGAFVFASFSELEADLDRQRYDPEIGQIDGLYPADSPVVIEADGQVRWQHLVAAFNAAVGAKYSNVRFADGMVAP
ncbi:MAG: biopolymer transporter ExbD [Algisphaera sp.]